MSPLHVDDRFGNALRAELVSRARKETPARTRRRSRLWFGAGALAGVGLLGGIGAAAAGFLGIPGGEKVTGLAAPVTETYAGTATIELGTPPEGTTGVQIEFTCLTPGRFEFEDGAGSECSQIDVDHRTEDDGWNSRYMIALTPGQHGVTIKTEPTSRWKVTAKYVKQETTDWGTNAKGESFGVENMEKGAPDLIAVIATNGRSGYAYAKDLYDGPMPTSPEDAAKNFGTPRPLREIPVYLSDGETEVGVFKASGSGGGIPMIPSKSPTP